MHSLAVSDAQGIRHQSFAEFVIGMVDGEAVRLKFYPRGRGRVGLVGCGDRRWRRDVRSGVHVEVSLDARVLAARFNHAQAIARRGDQVNSN